MKNVSARELQREIRSILDRVEQGESVAITRRGHPIARLVPAKPARVEPWPNLDARVHDVIGSRRIAPAPSKQLLHDRGER
ncbi:MAG: type II toxin-antitoxin system Phd/YefM family antitoxin [Actinomycetota bacterium]